MSMRIYVVLAVAAAGLLLWALCTPSTTVRAAGAKVGEIAIWAGLIAFCMAMATTSINC
jgi:hypothetical protein